MALLIRIAADYQLREPVYAVRINVDWRQGWTLNLLGSTLAPVFLPPGDQWYTRLDLGYLQPLRGWTWNYNLNLIGQDKLPFRQQDWPIYRSLPQPPTGWIQSSPIVLSPSLNVPFRQQSWPLTPDYQRSNPSWVLNLLQNTLTPAVVVLGNPRAPLFAVRIDVTWQRGWTQNLLENTLTPVAGIPPGEQVYDRPGLGPQQPLRNWTWNYNLNLIGQDALPFRQQDWPIYKPLASVPNGWIQSSPIILNASLGVPFRQQDWPNPKAPLQPLRGWTWSYNLNLIGQDQLPVGEQVTTLPPTGYLYPNQLRTWIQTPFILAQANIPFNQKDWPNPKAALQPTRSWVSWYNLNLIGKDKLPVGKQIYDRPVLSLDDGRRSWILPRNLPLNTPIVKLPFNQYDWPNPKPQPIVDHAWVLATNPNLFHPTPPVILPNIERPYIRDYWDRDEWGNFLPGSGIRRN